MCGKGLGPALGTTLSLALALAGAAGAASYEAPLDVRKDGRAKLTARPRARSTREGVNVSFSVSAPTDVEVAVIDSRGRVVRHLAAGLLGRNAPVPFRKNSLRQQVLWDRRDDAGKPVAGGPFKFRVRLCAKPRLEKIVGWDGNTLGSGVAGLAVGKDGEVYVMTSEGSRGRATMRVLDGNGKYLRTIIPYPANIPGDRLKSVGQIEVEGARLPIVYCGHSGSVMPMVSGMKKQSMCFSPKGYLIMTSGVGTIVEHAPLRHLLATAPEGGAPKGVSFVGPRIRKPRGMLGGAGEAWARVFDHLATSPDGRYVYLTQTIYGSRAFKQRHGVFRLRWTDEKLGEPFLGKSQPGSDDEHFNDPQGLAVDKKGNIFVCDRGNGRVMVYSGSGKLLGKFPVEAPEQIYVHSKTGGIYIASRKMETKRKRPGRHATIRKFSPWGRGQPRELVSLEARDLSVIALDPESSPPKLWAAYRGKLVQIIDGGAQLRAGQQVNNYNGLNYPMYMAADPDRNRIIIDDSFARRDALFVLDLKTGKKAPFVKGTDVAIDRHGNVHVMDGYSTNSLSRYDPSGKPLPFSSTGSHKIKTGVYRGYGPDLGMRGLCVAPNGDIYVLRSNNYGLEDGTAAAVDVFGPDGKLKKAKLIAGMGHGDCGLGVDAHGNVYVGCNVKLKEKPLPKALVGKVPAAGWRDWRRGRREFPWWYTYYNAYLFHCGAVLKFGPEGGAFYGQRPNGYKGEPAPLWDVANAPAEAEQLWSGYLKKEIKVKGVHWRYPGLGIVATSDLNWGDPCCMCMTSRFAVDGYGRVFSPNPFRFTVEMLDTNGNLVVRIGSYGNADSAGPKSKVPEPEIAFAWPTFVSTAGGKVYVCDATSQRVTVVRFEYADAAECAAR